MWRWVILIEIGAICTLDSSATSTSSPWIAGYQPSGSVASADESFTLQMHNLDTMFQFTFDLTAASTPSDSNPFVSDDGQPGSSDGPSGSDPHSGSSITGNLDDFEVIPTYQKVHGVLMGISILLLFPIGAIYMRVLGSPLIHGLIQVLSLCVLIVGFGLGIRMADIMGIVGSPFIFNLYCTLPWRILRKNQKGQLTVSAL